MPYSQVPDALTLDPDATLLEHRLYQYIDLRAGTSGWWDDSLVAISEALHADRTTLGLALKRLVARGLITVERVSRWRSKFLVPARLVKAQQMALGTPEVRPQAARHLRGQPAGGAGSPRTSRDRTSFRSKTSRPQTSISRSPDSDYDRVILRDGDAALRQAARVREVSRQREEERQRWKAREA